IADEMLRAREYDVNVMAVMRRVGVTGTKFSKSEDITELELTKIAAVTRLVTRPKKSMNVHEPMNMPLLAGVNQLYAEIGVNPRDNSISTEKGRGFDFYTVKKMLYEAEYTL
ncbi:MAG: radical SAM protein, partial [Christensenellaceae bacterium]